MIRLIIIILILLLNGCAGYTKYYELDPETDKLKCTMMVKTKGTQIHDVSKTKEKFAIMTDSKTQPLKDFISLNLLKNELD
jgi:hypothetical protein